MVVLKSTRSVVQCPLHQHNLHYLSKGLIGSDECRKAVEQLELLVRRVSRAARCRTSHALRMHQPSLPRQPYLRTPSQPVRVRSTSPASTQLHTLSSRRLDISTGVQEGRLSC